MGIYQPLSDRNSYLIFPPDYIDSIPLKSDSITEENMIFIWIFFVITCSVVKTVELSLKKLENIFGIKS